MISALLCLAARRNIKSSPKILSSSSGILLPRKLPVPLSTFTFKFYTCDESKSQEGKGSVRSSSQVPQHGPFNPKSFVLNLIESVKKGKLPIEEITGLANKVIAEGQINEYKNAPSTVQTVTFAGLGPMLGIPLLTLLTGHAYYCCVFAHLAYGACILSFQGGCNWMEAITKKDISYEKLCWCVGPPIIGWTSLILPLPLGMFLTSLGFTLSVIHDVLLTQYPPWMKALRVIFTGGTLLSFLLMLLFSIIL
uniref:Uncharacterized protein n=1 Tax=Pediculus humanus subsp. corporis TaxID=121224 RepID=A0A2Y9D430_PEDHC